MCRCSVFWSYFLEITDLDALKTVNKFCNLCYVWEADCTMVSRQNFCELIWFAGNFCIIHSPHTYLCSTTEARKFWSLQFSAWYLFASEWCCSMFCNDSRLHLAVWQQNCTVEGRSVYNHYLSMKCTALLSLLLDKAFNGIVRTRSQLACYTLSILRSWIER